MEIFGSTDVANLPSAILSIKSKNGLSYSSANNRQGVLDFEIPSSLGYYLGSGVNLSFDLVFSSDDGVVHNIRPQESCGLQGMIDSLRVYTFDGTLVEECVEWATLSSVFMSHSVAQDRYNKSGRSKHLGITQAYTGDYDGVIPYSSPSALPITPTVPIPAADQVYQTQKIQLPLILSNLLNADQVIPVAFMGGGLRIRILLKPLEEWAILHGDDVNTTSYRFPSTFAARGAENPPDQMEGIIPANGEVEITDDNNTITLLATDGIFNLGLATNGYNDGGGLVAIPIAAVAKADIIIALNAVATALVTFNDSITDPASIFQISCRNATLADITLAGSLFETYFSGAGVPFPTGGIVIPSGTILEMSLLDVTLLVNPGTYTIPLAIAAMNSQFTSYTCNEVTAIDTTAGAGAYGVGTIDIINNSLAAGGNTATLVGTGSTFFSVFCDGLPAPTTLADPTLTATFDLLSGGGAGSVLTVALKPFAFVNNPKDLNSCPLKVGQKVKGLLTDNNWSNESPQIDTITTDGTNIILTFVSNWFNTDPASIVNGFVRVSLDGTENLQYNMSEISLQVPIVSVPPSYQVALQGAVGSAEGMTIDMKAFQMVRTNAQAGQTLTANALPFISTKAKSLISIPYIVGGATLQTRWCADNLNNLRLTKYYYSYENVRHPERGVEADATRQGSLNQELLFELQKGFNYGLTKLENFNGFADTYNTRTFFLSRALGQFGSTYNTINKNIELTTESTSTVGGVENSCVLNHFSCCVNQLVMMPTGVILMR